jgi:mutator protein MutT
MEEKRIISCLALYKTKGNTVHIFLQKRADDAERAPGLFGFWGGGAEGNETPEETMLREIKEELDYAPKDYELFGLYELPQAIMSLFVEKVNDDFEKHIKISNKESGKWFSKDDYLKEKDLIVGDLAVLEELYEKLGDFKKF